MDDQKPAAKRGLRFAIRDLILIWLTLVVAMALGWYLDHQIMRRGRFLLSIAPDKRSACDGKIFRCSLDLSERDVAQRYRRGLWLKGH
jgi:hypothetical protein